MAKCSNCDYPYVPRYKYCPICGDRGNSFSSDGDGTVTAWMLLIILACWGIYSIYDYCVFNENDFIDKTYKLNNAEIRFRYSESLHEYFYSRDFNRDYITGSHDAGVFKLQMIV
jgi:hypothetical protein